MCGDEVLDPVVFVSMFVRVSCVGIPLTVISMAVLITPLPVQLQLEKYALLTVASLFSSTVNERTAPLPPLLTTFLNSHFSELIVCIVSLLGDGRERRGEEDSLMPTRETPLSVRVAVDSREMKEEERDVVDVSHLNSIFVMDVLPLRVNAGDEAPLVSVPTGFERRVVAAVFICWTSMVRAAGKVMADVSAVCVPLAIRFTFMRLAVLNDSRCAMAAEIV